MLQFFRERLAAMWQGRFMHGCLLEAGNVIVTKHPHGVMIVCHGPTVVSVGTGHWPFHLFEFGIDLQKLFTGHVGLFGFCAGSVTVHDLNEDGSLKGKDYTKYYWFFKGLNHQGKSLGEII